MNGLLQNGMCYSVNGILLLFAMLPFNLLSAQEYTFSKLEPRLQWHFRYGLASPLSSTFVVYFDSIPKDAEMTTFTISGPCNGTFIVNPYEAQERMKGISLSRSCTAADTLLLYAFQSYGELKYPVIRLFPREEYHVDLGADCYQLTCEPHNDPWMPSAEAPFLICERCYYLNWSNGRIMSGRRAIRLGLYDACEMKQWKQIIPEARYKNKAGASISGAKLISKGHIRRKHWNQEAF